MNFIFLKDRTQQKKIEKIYVLDGEFIEVISKGFINSVLFCQECYLKVKGKCKREYKSICRNLNINYKKIELYEILFSIDSFYKNLVKERLEIELKSINNDESFILEEN